MRPSTGVFCILLLYLFTLQSSTAALVSEHAFFAPLDESQNVKLYWNVSTANKEIFFTVEAKTTGWIGFGISSGQGRMKGADIVIGWVKDGKPYFKVSKSVRVTVICVTVGFGRPLSSEVLGIPKEFASELKYPDHGWQHDSILDLIVRFFKYPPLSQTKTAKTYTAYLRPLCKPISVV